MAQSLNQFTEAPVQGELDLALNPMTIAAQVAFDEATALIPGQAVKIVDSVDGIPKVTAVTADTDDVFGFVNYSEKDADFPAGAPCEISFFRGNVMYMTASAAIARNAKVMVVVSGSKVATRASSGICIGRALDKATANNDLIRVLIDLPGVAS